MKRFHALDGLRGIGALLIVIYHTHVLSGLSELRFFRNGYWAVEFFFVLSGFVLYHAYGRKNMDPGRFKRFFISRTFRIFPLHIVMLFIFILLELLKYFAGLKGYNFSNPAFTGSNTPSEILPNLLLLEGWLGKPGNAIRSFNTPTWSISIEFYTYLIFGSILFAFSGIRKYLFFILSVISFIALEIKFPYLNNDIFRGLSCFFTGCLCYLAYVEIEKLKLTNGIFNLLEITSITAAAVIIPLDLTCKNIIITLIFCAVVIAFSFDRGFISGLLKSKMINHLGKLSYSVYLTHYAILNIILSVAMIAGKLLKRSFTPTIGTNVSNTERFITSGNTVIDNLIVLVIIGLVIYISGVTYKHIEKKGIAFGKKINAKKEDPVPASVPVQHNSIS